MVTEHAAAEQTAATVVEHAAEAVTQATEAASHSGGILSDSYTWVSLSALIFVILAFKVGRAPILAFLDGRRNRIKTELEEARQLKAEAKALLEEYEARHAAAMGEAEAIVAEAKRYAEDLRRHAEKDMKEKMKRQEEILLNRIAAAEKEAVNDIRNKAVDLATQAAEKMLRDNIEKHDARLINETIIEIKKAV